MALREWSPSASGNSNVAGINFAEGQAPSSVNNSARELMAQIKDEYLPNAWGFVEVPTSWSVSIASQTTLKVAGDRTAEWVADRRVKLTGGSTTRKAYVVSSSYTAETTVTLVVDSGSLSSSHTVAALSVVYDDAMPNYYAAKNTPNLWTRSQTFTAQVAFNDTLIIKKAYATSASASDKGNGTINMVKYYADGGMMGKPVVKQATETITADVVIGDDAELRFTTAVGVNYWWRMVLFVTTTTPAGFRFDLDMTGGAPTGFRYGGTVVNDANATVTGIYGAAIQNAHDITSATATNYRIELSGTINTATAGSFRLRWRQETSDAGNTSVRIGSRLEWAEM
jgi:hypothetical protein